MREYKVVLVSIKKGALVAAILSGANWTVDASYVLVSPALGLPTPSYFDLYGLLLLVEIMVLFVAGGLMDVTSSASVRKAGHMVFRWEDWSRESQRQSQHRAGILIVAGAILFLQLLILTGFLTV